MVRLVILLFGVLCFPSLRGQDYGMETRPAAASFLEGGLPALQPGPTGAWTTVEAFPNLPLDDPSDSSFVFEPVYLTGAPRSSKLYVCDKKGKIWSFENHPDVSEKELFLDISSQVKITPNASMGTLAFHPDFGLAGSPNRGYVYTHYYWSPDPKHLGPKNQAPDSLDEMPLSGYWRLSRFTVPDGGEAVDPGSEYILIQQYDPHHWHNGGSIFFDNEGFLYLSSGDIGADKNYYKAGQSLTEGLFGTVLRIDVDQNEERSHPIRRQPTDHDSARKTKPKSWTEKSYTQGYYIPNDNPWQDEDGELLEEFWCLGIRSPHRMSYDPVTEEIWVGDVGQFRKEEVNFIVKGGNYQWPYQDGSLAGYAKKPGSLIGEDQPPIYEYTHTSKGAAVVGGYVYRGFKFRAELEGKYLFSEHQGGQVWLLEKDPNGGKPKVDLLTTIKGCGFHNGPSSFGQDNDGELYICLLKRNSKEKAITGGIVKLARAESTINPEPPSLLSETGVFRDIAVRKPAVSLVPYAPVAPFWSDAAVKTRYLSIPSGEKIDYQADENWSFPKGSVFVKHFDYPVDDRDPSEVKPIETRFMIHGADGYYFGLSYRWNEEGTDAELLTAGDTREIEVTTDSGGTRLAKWEFPSRAECMHCHTSAAGYVLGVRTHQLNSDFAYPSGIEDNQLRTLNHLGMLGGGFEEAALSDLLVSHPMNDSDATVESRVRSYLDSNCSHCHRPGGVYASFDARLTTPLEKQGIINGGLKRNYGIEGQGVIRPRDLEKSIMHLRLHSLGDEKMPPLGKNLIDTEAERVFCEWIYSLDPNKWTENSLPAAENGPPAAKSDLTNVWIGGEISIDVLGNDFDYDENLDPGSVKVVSPPTQGNVTFDADSQEIVYTHSGDSPDSFTYQVFDSQSLVSNLAKVKIGIRPIEEFDLPEPEPEPEPVAPEPSPVEEAPPETLAETLSSPPLTQKNAINPTLLVAGGAGLLILLLGGVIIGQSRRKKT